MVRTSRKYSKTIWLILLAVALLAITNTAAAFSKVDIIMNNQIKQYVIFKFRLANDYNVHAIPFAPGKSTVHLELNNDAVINIKAEVSYILSETGIEYPCTIVGADSFAPKKFIVNIHKDHLCQVLLTK